MVRWKSFSRKVSKKDIPDLKNGEQKGFKQALWDVSKEEKGERYIPIAYNQIRYSAWFGNHSDKWFTGYVKGYNKGLKKARKLSSIKLNKLVIKTHSLSDIALGR